MKMFKLLFLSALTFLAQTVSAESVWDAKTPQLDRPLEIVVYRSPTCGCCKKWVTHLENQQFKVTDIVTEDVHKIKQKHGVPVNLSSCHTALIDDYVIEGHVPAADIKKLLSVKSKVVGLTVPGMVTGSPGMEMGSRHDPFIVFSFDEQGKKKSYTEYLDY